jgi:hypothetical protein
MTEKVKVALVIDRASFEDANYGTGVVWAGQGDVQEVPADKWALMKKHADVWREVSLTLKEFAANSTVIVHDKGADTVTVSQGDAVDSDPALAEANAKITATLADLDNMTDEAVREFAASLEVKPHHKKTGAALRDAVREALAA